MAKFCSKCGNELKEGARFCSVCGNPVKAGTERTECGNSRD